MNDPKRMLGWMLVFLVAVAVACALLFGPLKSAFFANQVFNGLILAVLVVGVAINFVQVITLGPASDWIRVTERGPVPREAPSLLAPMARMLGSREREGLRLSAMAMR